MSWAVELKKQTLHAFEIDENQYIPNDDDFYHHHNKYKTEKATNQAMRESFPEAPKWSSDPGNETMSEAIENYYTEYDKIDGQARVISSNKSYAAALNRYNESMKERIQADLNI